MSNILFKSPRLQKTVVPFSNTENDMMHISRARTSSNTLIFIREIEIQKNNSFLHFARNYYPEQILDFRLAPRLDIFFGTRPLTFKLFEEFGITYYDFFGRIGVNSKDNLPNTRNYLTEALNHIWSPHRNPNRPTALIFDNEEILRFCKNCITEAFTNQQFIVDTLDIAEFKSGLLRIEKHF